MRAALFGVGALLASVAPLAVAAQSVTLKTDDGTINITGDLLEFAEGQYRVQTAMGEMHLRADAVTCEGPGCPSEITYVFGETVTLTTADQTVRVSGTLLDVVDNEYVLEVRGLGEVRLDVGLTECSGPGCPEGASATPVTLAALPDAPAPEADVQAQAQAEAEAQPPETPEPETAPQPEPEPDPQIAAIVEPEPETPQAEEPPAVARPLGPFRIAGSEDIGVSLMPYLIVGFGQHVGADVSTAGREQGGFRVSYTTSEGSDIGEGAFIVAPTPDAFADMADGRVDLVALPRQVTQDERNSLGASGGDITEMAIAYEALTISVHPSNPVDQLSVQDVARIYTGQITDWAQVGGNAGPITVLYPEETSDAYSVLQSEIFDGTGSGDAPPRAIRMRSLSQMAQVVQNDISAIGFTRPSQTGAIKATRLTGSCGLEFDSSAFSVKADEYPLGRRVFLYGRARDQVLPAAREFLNYMESPAADRAIDQSELLNFAIRRQAHTDTRLATLRDGLTTGSELALADAMGADMAQFDRLSTTIRFAPNSVDLGAKEQGDLRRLADYLDTLPQNSQVAIVGFADSSGGFNNNARLSLQRADTVAAALQAVRDTSGTAIDIVTRGYGELAPVACNTDAQGRFTNRRVEFWVSKSPN